MATQIGPKIGVDGEAEYRRQMSNIIQEARTLKAEMNLLSTEVTDEANAQENAARKAENLTQQIRNQEDRVRLLTEQMQLCAEKYGEADTKTLQYREQLANAQTVLNDLKQTQQGVNDTTGEFAAAEDAAGQAAINAGDLIKANLISEMIISGLKTLADLAWKAAKGLVECATGAAEYADEIMTQSVVTGLTTAQLQEYAYMAELVDVSVDTMTGSMRKLTTTMSKARDGSEREAAAFERLGIRATNADGTLRSSTGVFWEIIDALGQMEDGTERNALCMDLFGKSAAELNPLIAAGTAQIAAWAQEAREMGYVLDDETLERLGSLDDSMQRLDNLKTTIRNKLGAAMAPALERLVDKLIEFAAKVDWDALGESLGRLLDAIADALIRLVESGALDKLINLANSFLGGLFGGKNPEAQPGYNATVAAGGPVTDYQGAVREYARLIAAMERNQDLVASGEMTTTQFDEESREIRARWAELMEEWGDQIADDAQEVGADMDAALAAGIDDNAAVATEAWNRLVGSFRGMVPSALTGLAYNLGTALSGATGGSVNYGGVSVSVYGAEGMSAGELYDEFSYRLQNDVLAREAVYG